MAAIDELIQQIADPVLRDRIRQEADELAKQKKFGLVFEEHIPECTPLYEVPVKKGVSVALKSGKISDIWTVKKMAGGAAHCEKRQTHETMECPVRDLVCVAEFGTPIYPYLKPVDTVCNAPDSSLWHTLIEADNYHALQLLEYLYSGKVDCIYIDPPYNTGARDWKYNNDYVDAADSYRHSKWLSMMQKRLKIAKRLLNPKDSVLIVTIDEKEYLHLGCLLEEMFPEAKMQMISSVINPAGVVRKGEFSRCNEFIYFLMFGNSTPGYLPLDETSGNVSKLLWSTYRRHDLASRRGTIKGGISQFYPVYIDDLTKRVKCVGTPLPPNQDVATVQSLKGCTAVFPIRDNGIEMNWGLLGKIFMERVKKGYVKVGKYTPDKPQKYSISYLTEGYIKDIEDGKAKIIGYEADGSVICQYEEEHGVRASTQWSIPSHNAQIGSKFIEKILLSKRFTFPKSAYAVRDCLNLFTQYKPSAIILDFFAGSGTTLHAVNLLNAEDGGHRRCILVTNNEVSDDEAKSLAEKGYHPGDVEWEKLGIARYITWPRTVCSIEGHDVNGAPLTDSYTLTKTQDKEKNRNFVQISFTSALALNTVARKKQFVALLGKDEHGKDRLAQSLVKTDSCFIVSEDYPASILFDDEYFEDWLTALEDQDHVTDFYIVTSNNRLFAEAKKRIAELLGTYTVQEPVRLPMSDGFKANAAYFKLGFLDKTSIALGRQFRELLPLLWMKAGCVGPCPSLDDTGRAVPGMLILPENGFAVLIDDSKFLEFERRLQSCPDVQTVFIIIDSEAGYREMIAGLNVRTTYQLYRDYLDNFRINIGR